MARGLNKVMLIGNLGSDPELRTIPSGQTVANFTLATSESFKDSSGAMQERTEWHRIVAWGRLAEICGQYLKKGRQVYVEGRIQTRSWDDQKTGEKKYATDIVVTDMQMLGGMREGGSGYGDGGQQSYSPPQQPARQQGPQDVPPPQTAPSAPMIENDKDDLPF
ncbi:MAG: single-stranded DNA-binding protein [Pelodictyon luteolum]|uniref:Single-stranded DNA-binding protein n=1 Tax=Pelodictyon luteolum TaxID=1100 RepID=A0A165L0Y5_PELLU|nr:single-stranded DNA-binding protein [Pelodictyon luteolum]KZK73435.1 MAG: single-stranded DNA-binding protein [Pelodictyon luteolum]